MLGATGLDDAYGRVGTYAATYSAMRPLAGAGGGAGAREEITSSINTYAGTAHARAAFEAWRAAVPRQYQPAQVTAGMSEDETAAFGRDGIVLIGFRVRNVMGSVRAPEAQASELTRIVIARINRLAG